MAIEKTADVQARHEQADADIENLKQFRDDLRSETRAVIIGIEVQQRYASRLKHAATEILNGD